MPYHVEDNSGGGPSLGFTPLERIVLTAVESVGGADVLAEGLFAVEEYQFDP